MDGRRSSPAPPGPQVVLEPLIGQKRTPLAWERTTAILPAPIPCFRDAERTGMPQNHAGAEARVSRTTGIQVPW